MYLQHFGLAQHPFSLTPNTRFFLKLPSHQQAFNGLMEALNKEGHFASIVGEVGTGKTMLCRKVLNSLEFHRDKFITAYVPHPILSEDGIMHAIAEELSIDRPADIRLYDLIKLITNKLVELASEKRRVILFIDEAQAMPEETLKAVYLLTQIQMNQKRQLQVVLFGQPELHNLLDRNALHKIKEELSFSFELPALDLEGTGAYVQHRLAKAGYCGLELFSESALEVLYSASQGTPRMINILCNKALLSAYGKGDRLITDEHMSSAVADTESATVEKSWMHRLLGS